VDREQLAQWCESTAVRDSIRWSSASPCVVAGVRSIRIGPGRRHALEATITDGNGLLTAVFLAAARSWHLARPARLPRRGRREDGSANVMYNPLYEFV